MQVNNIIRSSAAAEIGCHTYKDLNLLIVKNLCAALIIGYDVLNEHSSLELTFDGLKEPFKVISMAAISIPAVPLFRLTPDCKPSGTVKKTKSLSKKRTL